MNQQIKDLIARANCTVDGTQEIDQEDIEKLCALIVKECASLCEARAWGMIEKGFHGHEAVEMCSDAIKEHFGVKE